MEREYNAYIEELAEEQLAQQMLINMKYERDMDMGL